jgi:hypothetical protein
VTSLSDPDRELNFAQVMAGQISALPADGSSRLASQGWYLKAVALGAGTLAHAL